MFKLIQNKDLLTSLNKYMFTTATMKHGFMVAPMLTPNTIMKNVSASNTFVPKIVVPNIVVPNIVVPNIVVPNIVVPNIVVPIIVAPPVVAPPVVAPPVVAPAIVVPKNTKPFTPFQKDKLFWCFFIILKGYDEYEMNHSNAFSVEKQLKIETVEKLKGIKEQLKDLKLKRTELEDELVNKQMITLKGLCALCLVHNVSITYVFGRKFCEILPQNEELAKKGIIIQNDKKEDSLKWTSNELNNNNEFITKLHEEYWLIENIQKPLKAPSAYTLTDLQVIAEKLLIETHVQVNEKSKPKVKTALYQEILQCI